MWNNNFPNDSKICDRSITIQDQTILRGLNLLDVILKTRKRWKEKKREKERRNEKVEERKREEEKMKEEKN